MIKRDAEPLLWLLFSAGGVASAMLLPALLFLFGVAFPLGWLTPPGRDNRFRGSRQEGTVRAMMDEALAPAVRQMS